jgi:hypothetical protein
MINAFIIIAWLLLQVYFKYKFFLTYNARAMPLFYIAVKYINFCHRLVNKT